MFELTNSLDKLFKYWYCYTRWANIQTIANQCTPHISENNIAIVHNGIIENYSELKKVLMARRSCLKRLRSISSFNKLLHER